jgi:hypothetical protein
LHLVHALVQARVEALQDLVGANEQAAKPNHLDLKLKQQKCHVQAVLHRIEVVVDIEAVQTAAVEAVQQSAKVAVDQAAAQVERRDWMYWAMMAVEVGQEQLVDLALAVVLAFDKASVAMSFVLVAVHKLMQLEQALDMIAFADLAAAECLQEADTQMEEQLHQVLWLVMVQSQLLKSALLIQAIEDLVEVVQWHLDRLMCELEVVLDMLDWQEMMLERHCKFVVVVSVIVVDYCLTLINCWIEMREVEFETEAKVWQCLIVAVVQMMEQRH